MNKIADQQAPQGSYLPLFASPEIGLKVNDASPDFSPSYQGSEISSSVLHDTHFAVGSTPPSGEMNFASRSQRVMPMAS